MALSWGEAGCGVSQAFCPFFHGFWGKLGDARPEIAPRPVALEKLVKPGREVGHIVLAHRFIANLVQKPAQIPLKLRLPLWRRPVIFGERPSPDHIGQRFRRLNNGFHRLRPLGLQQVIRILPLRQEAQISVNIPALKAAAPNPAPDKPP